MGPSEYTLSKLERKLRQDGIKETVLSTTDLVVRKEFGRPLFEYLIKTGYIENIPREQLKRVSNETLTLAEPSDNSDQPFVSTLSSGYILSETGLTLTNRWELIEESAAVPDYARQAMMAMLSRELFFGHLPSSVVIKSTYNQDVAELNMTASLIPRYANYYHWMIDTVPKIRYLQIFENETDQNVTALIPSNAPPFVHQTLQLLGWPQSKNVVAEDKMYKVNNLIVPSFPERRPTDLRWVRRNILSTFADEKQKERSSKYIYVSRSHDIERRVTNEDELIDMLTKYGFNKYNLEDRSVKENAKLFRDADIVIGPHGAGLTDILFSDECVLVEFFGKKVKHHYKNMAEKLDHKYVPMHCESKGADIVVNVDEVERLISNQINTKNAECT